MIPCSYVSAEKFLNGKNSKNVRGKKATKVARITTECIGLFYHDTPVVTWNCNGNTVLRTNNYRSVTTKRRINQAISGSVFQKNHKWYYSKDGNVVPFQEGMWV